VFSNRTPSQTQPNALARALEQIKADGPLFIDLTESNPTRAGFDYPLDLLTPLSDARALRYDPRPLGAIDARRAVAAEYRRHGIDVSPDRIVLTASTSDAYSMLFKLLANAGDEVLVPRPSYPLFEHLTRLDAVGIGYYDLEYHDRWSIDIAQLERAITPRTRAVLVVSPNNPTGSFLGAAELEGLADVCASRHLAIVADEVFADYEIETGARARAGRAAMRPDVLSFSLGGVSKSIGLPQVKLGWMAVAGPDRLVAEAIDRLEVICDAYLAVSTPVQIALPELLRRGADVRRQIADRVAGNYRHAKGAVAKVPSCRLLGADAGWYAVLQVPTLESEEALAVRLLTDDGVLTHPGYFFDFPRESFLVVSLLPERAQFGEGLARVLRHFDCSGGRP